MFEKSYRNQYNRKINKDKLEIMFNDLGIIEKDYIWSGSLEYGNNPKELVIHHAASNTSIDKINESHKERGWSGIGYHFFIQNDGTIYRGRPEEAKGAHVEGYNTNTLGICLQGNFEKKMLNEAQRESLVKLMTYLSFKYPIGEIKGHRDLGQTLCPGKNISVDSIREAVIETMKLK